MDIPLELNNIGIRYGLKGYKRKSSTFSLQTDVVGLSVSKSLGKRPHSGRNHLGEAVYEN